MTTNDKRIHEILSHVKRLASGNFREFLKISDRYDEIDGISAGLNHLTDALQRREATLRLREERIERLLSLLRQYLPDDINERLAGEREEAMLLELADPLKDIKETDLAC